MRAHLRYLRYILRHKWFVFVECRRLGIPWLGLIHDLSKFLPSEWGPYVRYFYGRKGETDNERWRIGREFDIAWNHHQKRNKHHWQYWVLANDNGPVYSLAMPDRYRREMLADWRGAGKAVGKPDTRAWYLEQRVMGRQNLHPETRFWIECQLEALL